MCFLEGAADWAADIEQATAITASVRAKFLIQSREWVPTYPMCLTIILSRPREHPPSFASDCFAVRHSGYLVAAVHRPTLGPQASLLELRSTHRICETL